MTSNWPGSQDNDTTLGRYISTDSVVPNCWNVHTDAIEAMQATLQPALGAPSGTVGQVLAIADLTGPTYEWVDAGGGGGSLTKQSVYLSADVTMTLVSTDYDILSITLAAGTWLLMAACMYKPTVTADYAAFKLWDGTTIFTTAMVQAPTTVGTTVGMSAFVVPTVSTTYKITANSADAGSQVKAAATYAYTATNTGTYILALKIA